MENKRDHISVCIPTYKRPKLLEQLLEKLENQETDNLFSYSIVVVDNDLKQSAASTIENIKKKSSLAIDYFCEPQQNISLARNKSVQNAKGNLIAFIDDDEFPENNWLFCLYKAHVKYGACGILGPVKPRFETPPPRWVIKGKLCERASFKTGTLLTKLSHTRTGNALILRKIFGEEKNPFDPAYGKTGGEDNVFFKRMMLSGYTFVWCDEAVVYETIAPRRLRRPYFLRSALLKGAVHSKGISFISFDILKSIIALVIYTAALPVLLLAGQHL
ncbi:MAG: glycosyltransferase, partial [Candidatus Omnitrophica bacterium]|nr:glycosyltransferase [Candidatus Omnitrophota bacterium]